MHDNMPSAESRVDFVFATFSQTVIVLSTATLLDSLS